MQRKIKSMITKEFIEGAKELNAILEYAPNEYVEKIPKKLREFFKEIESKEYEPKIDPNLELDKQELLPKTKDLITVIYRNYWCTKEEREELDKILIENDRKYEKELREKYNPDDIFKNRNVGGAAFDDTQYQENITKGINELPVEIKESLFRRVVKFLKNVFKR